MRSVTMISKALCLLAALAMVLGLPTFELEEHIDRIIRSEETDGYDIATIHAVDPATNEEIRQSRRDIAEHASDSSPDERTYSLRLTSGEQLRMSVQRRSIDFSGATFTELTEEGHREEIHVNPDQCFFSGQLENEEGFASLSMCDGELVGFISTPDRDYQIHGWPQSEQDPESSDDSLQILVTWQNTQQDEEQEEVDDGLEIPEDSDSSLDEIEVEAEKRSAKNHQGTIEICDVVDSYYIDAIHRKLLITNSSKIIELLISKWSSAAHMLSNKTQVGWDLRLRLVRVEIWRSHPDWYTAKRGEKMGARLNEICRPTASWQCDQITLHTEGTSDRKVVGLAWVGGVCSQRRRCSSVRSANTGYMAELHELGHNLGLKHDGKERRCYNGTDPVHGFMGGNRLHFRECYKEVLAISLPKKRCLFEDIVNASDIVMDFPQH